MQKFTFFDLETPNRLNDKICSFGLIHMVDGEIIFEGEFLVNPETYFDTFNVELHGVSAEMVRNEPTFDRLWETVKPYFTDSIIVAHNATFDLTVLSKVLFYYGFEIPEFQYSCTWQMAKARLKVPRYSLDALCQFLNVPLNNHHNAMEDTQACYGVFVKLYRSFEYLPSDIVTFRAKVDRRYQKKKDEINRQEGSFYNALEDKSVQGKMICLSGNFKYGTKEAVASVLIEMGAICHPSVTQQVDILLVGSYGHEKWCCGNYGTKVQKAIHMQEKGSSILIVREEDLI